jgi:hypothetical protein
MGNGFRARSSWSNRISPFSHSRRAARFETAFGLVLFYYGEQNIPCLILAAPRVLAGR